MRRDALRIAALAFLGFTLSLRAQTNPGEYFETKVRPVLAKNCFACHAATSLGGLRLDSRETLLQGGKSGPAIVPGNPSASLLIQAVEHTHARFKMPPQGKLTPEEIGSLRAWIGQGAPWPSTVGAAPVSKSGITPEQRAFWSFQPVRKPAIPVTKDRRWARTGIDHFLLAKLEAQGLQPAPPTDRRTLLRRVTLDLIGLPPTPEEVDAFLQDRSPEAFEKVVDRLLASPHYGERWARHWLDLARYSDGRQGARLDTPYPNAFRYRDWVVDSFNKDLPYNEFIKAQLAADFMPGDSKVQHLPGLGFQTLGESDEDRVDVTTRVFLGLTVGCAQCHDHKFDPLPTLDYYSLLGVFRSSKITEHPLVPEDVVTARKLAQKNLDEKKAELKQFLDQQTLQVTDLLAAQTEEFLVAGWKKIKQPSASAPPELDSETLERWVRYLQKPEREHPNLFRWDALMKNGAATETEVRAAARELHHAVHAVIAERKALEDRNYVKLGGLEGLKDETRKINTLVEAMPIERYYFWRDMASRPYKVEDMVFSGGVYYYGAKDLERFLNPAWKRYLTTLRAEETALEKAVPSTYPFWHVLADSEKPANIKVAIRGDANNPGEEAPRRFLQVLSAGTPQPFHKGSGRLELAEAIASPENPLTARVMVNRIWKEHFGEGIVRSTSNFGQLGDRPSHPELLDYLAARFIEGGWSIKAMHREMLLSSAYRMSSEGTELSRTKDPDNQLFSRGPLCERMDAESLRDSILAVAGVLDLTTGGESKPLTDEFQRRTLYGTVSRSTPDRSMAIFDFPDPNSTSEQRITTVGPMQRLYFLNSQFVIRQAKALAERVCKEAAGDPARIDRTYRLLFGRSPSRDELRLGAEYLSQGKDAWPRYAQVLLGTAEFTAVQ